MVCFVVKCYLLEGLTFLEPFKIFVPLCVLALWQLVRFFGSVKLQDSLKLLKRVTFSERIREFLSP